MFGDYRRSEEARQDDEDRIDRLRALLLGGDEEGDEHSVAAMSLKSNLTSITRTDQRRDPQGRRIDKPHAPGATPKPPTRRRDAEGHRVDKENDLRRFSR